MEVNVYNKVNDRNKMELIINSWRLSHLMADRGYTKPEVYCLATNIHEIGIGNFFSVQDSGKSIAYGVITYAQFLNGNRNKKVKQLTYFAVHRELRGNGTGTKALRQFLQSEVPKGHLCQVSCKPELRSFYERLGFKYRGISGNVEEIILVYSSSKKLKDEDLNKHTIPIQGFTLKAREQFKNVNNWAISKNIPLSEWGCTS